MRYLRQYTNTDCGPVACLNIRKFLGQKVTYQDIYKMRKDVGHCPDWGVLSYGIDFWLRKNKINNIMITNPKMSDIKRALCDGYAVLARTCYKKIGRYFCHYTLLVDYEYGNPRPYTAINYQSGETYTKVSYKGLKSQLISNPDYTEDTEPYIWIIRGEYS